ncbi:hypothetical protein B0H13DRAFT_1857375 [Mycena leptocephala]|nr:hypothetical protein B0H13DRAFT_1857375 [Mycena leptocephala]
MNPSAFPIPYQAGCRGRGRIPSGSQGLKSETLSGRVFWAVAMEMRAQSGRTGFIFSTEGTLTPETADMPGYMRNEGGGWHNLPATIPIANDGAVRVESGGTAIDDLFTVVAPLAIIGVVVKVRGGAGNYCFNRPRVTGRSRACGGVYARLRESGVCGFRMLEAPALHPCNTVDCTAHQGIEERARGRLARSVQVVYGQRLRRRLWSAGKTYISSRHHMDSAPGARIICIQSRCQPGHRTMGEDDERTPSRSSTSPVLRRRGGRAPASLGNVCTLHWVVRTEDRGILGNSGLSVVNSTPGKALRQCFTF